MLERNAPWLVLALAVSFAVVVAATSCAPPENCEGASCADYCRDQYAPLKLFWNWTTHDAVSFYTLVLAIFTAVLGGTAIVQISYLRKADETALLSALAASQNARAAKTSADAAIALERPRLFLGKVDLKNGTAIDTNAGTHQITKFCGYNIENYGRTPAILQWSCVDFRYLQGLPDTPPYRSLRAWRDRVIYWRGSIDDLTCSIPNTDLPLDRDIQGYELFLFGYFTFEDVFGKSRKTGFCYVVADDKFLRMRMPAYDYDIEE